MKMKVDYRNTIVYSEYENNKIYYLVRDDDGLTIRLEQLNRYVGNDNDKIRKLNNIKRYKRNIVYFGCSYYDKKN